MFPCGPTFPLALLADEWSAPLLAFPLTVALEWPLLAWWSGRGLRRTGLFCLVLNGVSWGFGMGVRELWDVPVPLLEAGIVLVEAGLLVVCWGWRWRRALPVSTGMNLVSWLLGTALLLRLLKR